MPRLSAGTRKRKNGTFEKRFTINGKRISIYARTIEELNRKEQDARSRAYVPNAALTFDRYFSEWIERRRGYLKPITTGRYISIYNAHIKTRFGEKKLTRIERREILDFQKELSKSLKASTANGIFSVLQMILTDAERDEAISRNPARNIKRLKEQQTARETIHRALTEAEQAAFMAEARKHQNYYILAFMLSTGIRYGEAAALTYGDIDYKSGVVHIKRTASRTENHKAIISDSPKTARGVRDIPLTDATRALLKAHRGNIIPRPETLIFPGADGGMICLSEVNKAINRTLKALEQQGTNIEPFSSHALRDTFATRYIEQGGTPQNLKDILGHSSYKMTMDLYAHVLPDAKKREMEKIEIVI